MFPALADQSLQPLHSTGEPSHLAFDADSAAVTVLRPERMSHRRVPLLGTSGAGTVGYPPHCFYEASGILVANLRHVVKNAG